MMIMLMNLGETNSAKLVSHVTSLKVRYMSHLLLLGKFEYSGGPIFKVVLEC